MKRKVYLITFNEKTTWIKNSWNSAIKSIEKHVKETIENEVNCENMKYVLTQSESFKDNSGFYFEHGIRIWYCEKTHNKLSYRIQKVL